jgi:ketosteroid isomerase-like protein
VTASANLDLVRSIFAAWERGDYSSAEWAHPEVEFVTADGPDPGQWKGLAATAEASRDFLSTWEDYRIEPAEYREIDERRVLVLVRVSARGKTSGLDLGQLRTRGAWLFHVHRGKVTQLVRYFDRDRALADLGLAPESGSR